MYWKIYNERKIAGAGTGCHGHQCVNVDLGVFFHRKEPIRVTTAYRALCDSFDRKLGFKEQS